MLTAYFVANQTYEEARNSRTSSFLSTLCTTVTIKLGHHGNKGQL
ncbi:unnamed protein product [Brassica napus]|uniref:(rape) hypothetical protein n=1 Tax=Brassica napus TaxID=3708 RepID=A0A816SPC8_BRANA|nr:unnamed protein product [Brassica napus]